MPRLLLVVIGGAIVTLTAVGESSPTADEAARIAAVIRPATDFSRPETYELNPAGAATSSGPMNRSAFSQPSANMDFERQLDFRVGDGIFRKLWVSAPSSTRSSDGLGPLYNARSCQSCHLKDGRGHPPAAGEQAGGSMLMRLSIPPTDDLERDALDSFRQMTLPEPTYGGQLQDLSIQGHLAEGHIRIDYEEIPIELADGETVRLRKPSYDITDLNYGPMHEDVMMSPRVAPQMIGLGLFELIEEADRSHPVSERRLHRPAGRLS